MDIRGEEMTAPAEDHTGEDQFGPFIVEHNEIIRKKAINEVLDKIENFFDKNFDSMNDERFEDCFKKKLASLRQQEQS